MADSKHLVSIILPTYSRPRELARCLNALYNTDTEADFEVLASMVDGDEGTRHVLSGYPVNFVYTRNRIEYERGAVYAWNTLAEYAQGDVIALFADDLIPEHDWLDRSLAHLDRIGGGLVGFNDLGTDGNLFAAHFIASRNFLKETMGGVIYPPQYRGWWCDRELSDRAQAVGKHVWAQDAIVEHVHYTWGKSQIDQTYADSIPYHEADRLLYEARKADGFPIDYEGYL